MGGSLKSAVLTGIAFVGILTAGYNYLSDTLEIKMEKIAEQTALKTYEVFQVEDAVYELDKENYKFLTGKSDSIRKQNMELVIRYSSKILKKYPNKGPQIQWALRYYHEHFVENFN